MPYVLLESPAEFIARHGNASINLSGTDLLICPDGATISLDGGIRSEPSPNPHDNLDNRRRFLLEVVQRAEANFSKLKRDLMDATQLANLYSNLPAPNANDAAMLADLCDRAKSARQALEAFDNEHVHSDPARERREAALVQRQTELRSLLRQLQLTQL